jgi:hypothetical protein
MVDDRILWQWQRGATSIACVMVSCCAGAELQLLEGDRVVLRELYPSKSDLYDRARALEQEYRSRGGDSVGRNPAVAKVDNP